jgi:quinol monooxygenase YgiN
MFAITGTMNFDPSDRDAILENLVPLVAASQAEDGNVAYVWSEDLSQPATFHFYEHWGSEEAFASHCQTPHYLSFNQTVMPRIKGVTAYRHEISSSKSMV